MAKPAETTDALRKDIDSGRTGEKVPHEDPSAAPLGTDDEAGGRAPTKAEVAMASSAEQRGGSSFDAPVVSEERSRPDLSSSAPRWVWPVLAILGLAALTTLIAAVTSL